jgi:hypothetical protein
MSGNRVATVGSGCESDSNCKRNNTNAFRSLGLPAEEFTHLFDLSDFDLAVGVRRTVDGKYPCRVSLTDSQPGEELLLINYEHHPVESPYRMRFAIFVREGDQTSDKVNEIPEQLRNRVLAVRSFTAEAICTGLDGSQQVAEVLDSIARWPTDRGPPRL